MLLPLPDCIILQLLEVWRFWKQMLEMGTNATATSSSNSATRFVCISDNHDNYDFVLPDGDILLYSGDFTCNSTEGEIETFAKWLKIVIGGNHESHRFYSKKRYKKLSLVIEQLKTDQSLTSNYGIIYLQDQAFQDSVTGWKFYSR